MADLKCPGCGNLLKGAGSLYSCPGCGKDYRITFTCAECGSEPEEISACGSVGYFCHTCNAPRSRTSMNKGYSILSDR